MAIIARWSGKVVAGLVCALSIACGSDQPTAPPTGSLAVVIRGLPSSSNAAVTVTGPDGYSRTLGQSQTIDGLPVGSYSVLAATVKGIEQTFAATPGTQAVTISARSVATATVVYSQITGSMTVTLSGVPSTSMPSVAVSGPGGFADTITGSATLTNLSPGPYRVVAGPITVAPNTYAPAVPAQTATIAADSVSRVSVAYGIANTTLNLAIDGLYLTQSTQTFHDSVPLVAGKPALLRVFVTANVPNQAVPTVRVRFFQNGSPVDTATIAAPHFSVPVSTSEADITSSWNLRVPGALIQPGLTVSAEVNPDHLVVETTTSDDRFPAGGGSLTFSVVRVPVLKVRLIPIHFTSNNTTGNVSDANKDAFMALTSKLHPISAYDVDVHAVFSTDLPTLEANDGNGSWGALLSALDAVRIAEGSDRYYAGFPALPSAYGSGLGGLTTVLGHTSVMFDNLPPATEALAHELGHDFGRRHAACGGRTDGIDPNYPYPEGQIGAYGYNVPDSTPWPPTTSDIMTLCPLFGQNFWTSDYNYNLTLQFLAAQPASAGLASSAVSRPVQRTLLVWGRIEQGDAILEPAVSLVTRPVLPAEPGPFTVEGLDEVGASVFAISFAGESVADGPDDARHFAFAIPITDNQLAHLAAIRLRGGGRKEVVRRRQPLRPAIESMRKNERSPIQILRTATGQRIRWDTDRYVLALARDAQSGQILAISRRGSVMAPPSARIELLLSDGVQTRDVPLTYAR